MSDDGEVKVVMEDRISDFGRIVGLLASIAYVAIVVAVLLRSLHSDIADRPYGIIWFFNIILSGPVTYFYVSAGTKMKLTHSTGTATIVGGYAVSIVSFFLVTNINESRPQLHYLAVSGTNHTQVRAGDFDEVSASKPAHIYQLKCAQEDQLEFVLDSRGLRKPVTLWLKPKPQPLNLAQSLNPIEVLVELPQSQYDTISIDWP